MRYGIAAITICGLALAASPTLAAPPKGDGPALAVPTGSYECWAYGRARLLLNFTVTGTGRYRASDDSTGTFSYNPQTKALKFAGYLADVLPKGFTTIYHEPKGMPTVSFHAADGEEITYCEKV